MDFDPNQPNTILCPGFTAQGKSVPQLVEHLVKMKAVLDCKASRQWAWVVVLGGTGTGKSTLFNALCQAEVSRAGVVRPQTRGAVLFAHRSLSLEKHLPFFLGPVDHKTRPSENRALPGQESGLAVVRHDREDLKHLVLVDTPDVDSLVLSNRKIAEDCSLLSDLVLFVTSQDKYADQAPTATMLRILQEKKPFFFVLNKTDQTKAEGRNVLLQDFSNQLELDSEQARELNAWTRFLPFLGAQAFQDLKHTADFQKLCRDVRQRLHPDTIQSFLQDEGAAFQYSLHTALSQLLEALELEDERSREWKDRVEGCFQKAVQDLLEQEEQRFQKQGKTDIQAKINRLYARFDFLAKPRRLILSPLYQTVSLLRLAGRAYKKERKKDLQQIRQNWDPSPMIQSVTAFKRDVLEQPDSEDEAAPLQQALQAPELSMEDSEIVELVQEKQDELAAWLNQTFEDLTRKAPRGRRIGIYSITTVWGVLLLSFEVVLGGGLTLVEGLADTILGPFLSKGAVKVFAFRDIRSISKELALRYRKALTDILELQKERYLHALDSVSTSGETVRELQDMAIKLQESTPSRNAGGGHG